MRIVPLSLKEANAFVERYHRHNKKVVTHKFSIGLEEQGELIGVAIGANPIARLLDDGKTFEIRRVCVKPGFPNACSKLLARVKRIAQMMGYEKVITYTLQKESGSSLKAVNGRRVAEVRPQRWKRNGKLGTYQKACDEWKYRWELQEANTESDPAPN